MDQTIPVHLHLKVKGHSLQILVFTFWTKENLLKRALKEDTKLRWWPMTPPISHLWCSPEIRSGLVTSGPCRTVGGAVSHRG